MVAGIATGSLALLSDAGHMLTDVLGLGMALAAIQLASRGSSRTQNTFGLYRVEIFMSCYFVQFPVLTIFFCHRYQNKWGTRTARVLRVRAASTVSAVRLRSLPTSANTGVAPTAKIGATTVLQQKLGIITSSPWSR